MAWGHIQNICNDASPLFGPNGRSASGASAGVAHLNWSNASPCPSGQHDRVIGFSRQTGFHPEPPTLSLPCFNSPCPVSCGASSSTLKHVHRGPVFLPMRVTPPCAARISPDPVFMVPWGSRKRDTPLRDVAKNPPGSRARNPNRQKPCPRCAAGRTTFRRLAVPLLPPALRQWVRF